jgi:hypothetical protein
VRACEEADFAADGKAKDPREAGLLVERRQDDRWVSGASHPVWTAVEVLAAGAAARPVLPAGGRVELAGLAGGRAGPVVVVRVETVLEVEDAPVAVEVEVEDAPAVAAAAGPGGTAVVVRAALGVVVEVEDAPAVAVAAEPGGTEVVVRAAPGVVVEVEDAPAVAAAAEPGGTAVVVRAAPGVAVEVEDAPAVAAAGLAGTAVVVEVEDAPAAVRPVACSAVGRDVTAVQLDASAVVRDGCPVAWACSEAGRGGSRAALVLTLAEPLVGLVAPVCSGVGLAGLVGRVWSGADLVGLLGRAWSAAGLVGRA